ncbi:MAG: hypothetical protein R3F53_08945 [Gammaproteobacteria bacterium]
MPFWGMLVVGKALYVKKLSSHAKGLPVYQLDKLQIWLVPTPQEEFDARHDAYSCIH